MKLFNLFFTTRIPENLRYRSFSPLHFVLLLGVAICIFLAARRMKRLNTEEKHKMLLIFTWALPVMYVFRFTMFEILGRLVEPQIGIIDRLPFHLCTLNAIVMPLAVLKKNKILLNYVYAIALPGAVAAMLTPAMSFYGRYFYFSWQVVFFFLDHGLMAAVAILAISSGLMRPDVRALPKATAAFLGYCAVIYPVNKIFNQNFLFLNYPDEGTVMTFFAKYFGNPGYLVPMAVLAAVLIFLMYLPWILLDRRACLRGQAEDELNETEDAT